MSVKLELLSTPVSYRQFESYSAVREQVKQTCQQDHYKNHVILFGLAWMDQYLAACTSHGELVVWKIAGEDDDNTMEFTKAIYR